MATHGMYKTRIYSRWIYMKTRCRGASDKFKYYGSRGIKICERWGKFENFLEDMGDSFREDLSLDRIDNDKGYSKSNCRWATAKEQANNTREHKKRRDCTSKYKGVSWHREKNKWLSQLCIKNKKTFLGYFNSEIAAHRTHLKARGGELGNAVRHG